MHEVCITGRGLIVPAGDAPGAVHEALCSGTVPAGAPARFCRGEYPDAVVSEIADFTPQTYLGNRNVRPLDRTGQLATVAAHLGLEDSGWTLDARRDADIGLVLGTAFGGMHTIGEFDRRGLREGHEYVSPLDFANTVFNAAAGQTAIWHQLRGLNSTIAMGSASGLHAIAYAAGAIRAGRAHAVLAGGADELSLEAFIAYRAAGLVRVATAPEHGIVLSEGGALVMLESSDSAGRRGARVLGSVKGTAAGFDPFRGSHVAQSADTVARVTRAALADAGVEPDGIGLVCAGACGDAMLDAVETGALEKVFGGCRNRVAVMAPRRQTGDLLGASGAVQALLALDSLRVGQAPGSAVPPAVSSNALAWLGPGPHAVSGEYALVTSLTREGHCAALVLAVAREEA